MRHALYIVQHGRTDAEWIIVTVEAPLPKMNVRLREGLNHFVCYFIQHVIHSLITRGITKLLKSLLTALSFVLTHS